MFNTKKEREQKHTVTALYSNTCFINNISNSESFQSEHRFDPIVGKRCEIRFQHHMINVSVFLLSPATLTLLYFQFFTKTNTNMFKLEDKH